MECVIPHQSNAVNISHQTNTGLSVQTARRAGQVDRVP